METIERALNHTLERIRGACLRAQRPPSEVTLLAVGKTKPASDIRTAFQAGQRDFGENYVQEALAKIAELKDLHGLRWHLIGPLQANKTRDVAAHFDWVHSVDRLRIAQRLSDQRPAGLPPLQVCLQVNVSGEASKSGVDPAELPELAAAVAALPRLQLRGLMSIPEPLQGLSAQRQPHRTLRLLMEDLCRRGLPLDTLSMGMSDDLEAAVMEGSTMVRVGTAIFGARGGSARTVSLIGAPTDIGAGARGASMGPEAMRVAGLREALQGHGLEVQDRGNLVGPHNPWQPPVEGYRHLPEVVAWNRAVHEAVLAELQAQRLPILLGGDHCLAVGSISAVARHCRQTGRKLRVLWLDAHADFNTSALTPSGNVHGMPVACLCGHGPQELVRLGLEDDAAAVASISPKWIRQIGIRSVDPGEKRFVHEQGLEVFDMRFIDEMGMRHAMELALATMDERTHLHVSFDVDFLDPDIAPGVGTTIPGGPTYREAQLCMEMIADTGRLGSLDIMELNPALDVRNKTAELAVDLVESLFGKSTLMRKS